jgi:hypothetical protein
MHSKYARDGFVAVSVSLDPAGDKKARAAVEKFLNDKKAAFTNVVLDAKPAEWQAKLKVDGPPCIYVFDRENRVSKKLPRNDKNGEPVEDVDWKVIEKKVAELVKTK